MEECKPCHVIIRKLSSEEISKFASLNDENKVQNVSKLSRSKCNYQKNVKLKFKDESGFIQTKRPLGRLFEHRDLQSLNDSKRKKRDQRKKRLERRELASLINLTEKNEKRILKSDCLGDSTDSKGKKRCQGKELLESDNFESSNESKEEKRDPENELLKYNDLESLTDSEGRKRGAEKGLLKRDNLESSNDPKEDKKKKQKGLLDSDNLRSPTRLKRKRGDLENRPLESGYLESLKDPINDSKEEKRDKQKELLESGCLESSVDSKLKKRYPRHPGKDTLKTLKATNVNNIKVLPHRNGTSSLISKNSRQILKLKMQRKKLEEIDQSLTLNHKLRSETVKNVYGSSDRKKSKRLLRKCILKQKSALSSNTLGCNKLRKPQINASKSRKVRNSLNILENKTLKKLASIKCSPESKQKLILTNAVKNSIQSKVQENESVLKKTSIKLNIDKICLDSSILEENKTLQILANIETLSESYKTDVNRKRKESSIKTENIPKDIREIIEKYPTFFPRTVSSLKESENFGENRNAALGGIAVPDSTAQFTTDLNLTVKNENKDSAESVDANHAATVPEDKTVKVSEINTIKEFFQNEIPEDNIFNEESSKVNNTPSVRAVPDDDEVGDSNIITRTFRQSGNLERYVSSISNTKPELSSFSNAKDFHDDKAAADSDIILSKFCQNKKKRDCISHTKMSEFTSVPNVRVELDDKTAENPNTACRMHRQKENTRNDVSDVEPSEIVSVNAKVFPDEEISVTLNFSNGMCCQNLDADNACNEKMLESASVINTRDAADNTRSVLVDIEVLPDKNGTISNDTKVVPFDIEIVPDKNEIMSDSTIIFSDDETSKVSNIIHRTFCLNDNTQGDIFNKQPPGFVNVTNHRILSDEKGVEALDVARDSHFTENFTTPDVHGESFANKMESNISNDAFLSLYLNSINDSVSLFNDMTENHLNTLTSSNPKNVDLNNDNLVSSVNDYETIESEIGANEINAIDISMEMDECFLKIENVFSEAGKMNSESSILCPLEEVSRSSNISDTANVSMNISLESDKGSATFETQLDRECRDLAAISILSVIDLENNPKSTLAHRIDENHRIAEDLSKDISKRNEYLVTLNARKIYKIAEKYFKRFGSFSRLSQYFLKPDDKIKIEKNAEIEEIPLHNLKETYLSLQCNLNLSDCGKRNYSSRVVPGFNKNSNPETFSGLQNDEWRSAVNDQTLSTAICENSAISASPLVQNEGFQSYVPCANLCAMCPCANPVEPLSNQSCCYVRPGSNSSMPYVPIGTSYANHILNIMQQDDVCFRTCGRALRQIHRPLTMTCNSNYLNFLGQNTVNFHSNPTILKDPFPNLLRTYNPNFVFNSMGVRNEQQVEKVNAELHMQPLKQLQQMCLSHPPMNLQRNSCPQEISQASDMETVTQITSVPCTSTEGSGLVIVDSFSLSDSLTQQGNNTQDTVPSAARSEVDETFYNGCAKENCPLVARKKKLCVNCENVASLWCSLCKKVKYCSRSCANSYWNERHKMECTPIYSPH